MRAAGAAITLLVLLAELSSGEALGSAEERKVSRRPRRDHVFSRTLSDHSSSMPHGFYSRSTDVSLLPLPSFVLIIMGILHAALSSSDE